MKKKRALPLAVTLLTAVAVLAFRGSVFGGQEESKEHPQEHPAEHPAELSTVAVTNENLAQAIRDYIAAEAKKHEGLYVCTDDKSGKTLGLTLKKVHDDKLASIGDNTYFACADFETADGKMYDIDIFMKGESVDKLVATDVAVHKEDGMQRYTWAESEGVWHKVPVKKEAEGKGEKQ